MDAVIIPFLFLLHCHGLEGKKYSQPAASVIEAELFPESHYYQADSSRLPTQQKCVEIPQNMSLCYGIGYQQMLLPNLLEHETLAEATEQSASWLPLANIKCHQHTQLFLCSLFAPICPIQHPAVQPDVSMPADQALPPFLTAGPTIYPCRSLCESVKSSCQGVMNKHGFPWPDILECGRFPLDNDMCIAPNANAQVATTPSPTPPPTMGSTKAGRQKHRKPVDMHHVAPTAAIPRKPTPASSPLPSSTDSCDACQAVVLPKELDAAYCRAQFVSKIRFRRQTRRGAYLARRPRILRLTDPSPDFNRTASEESLNAEKSLEFLFDPSIFNANCRVTCAGKVEPRSQMYLVFGRMVKEPALSTKKSRFPQVLMERIMPWFTGPLNRDFRQAEKRLQNLKCNGRTDNANTVRKGNRNKKRKGAVNNI